MKYMGSKRRIYKDILPIMLSESYSWWVEPFVGGGNMIDKVSGSRLGSDINPYVIQALIDIRDNVTDLPKNNLEFTEMDYKLLRVSDDYRYKGFAGFAYSYGGKWLGGWCRDGQNKRDYVREAYNNALKQSPMLRGIDFVVSDYRELDIPRNSLIYCDPPYRETTKYAHDFDHDIFWNWCREKREKGHKIFVSEYTCPEDFECVWEGKLVSSLTKDTGNKIGVERLFTIP